MDLVTLALAKRYIDKKISEEGVVTGATPQQAAQIEQNRTDIADLQAEIEGNYVKSVNGMGPDENGNVEIPAGVDVSGAQVGQTIVVKSVDENGKPTEWEAADKPVYIADVTFRMGRYFLADGEYDRLLNAYENGAAVSLNSNSIMFYLVHVDDEHKMHFAQIPYGGETALAVSNWYLVVSPDNSVITINRTFSTTDYVQGVIIPRIPTKLSALENDLFYRKELLALQISGSEMNKDGRTYTFNVDGEHYVNDGTFECILTIDGIPHIIQCNPPAPDVAPPDLFPDGKIPYSSGVAGPFGAIGITDGFLEGGTPDAPAYSCTGTLTVTLIIPGPHEEIVLELRQIQAKMIPVEVLPIKEIRGERLLKFATKTVNTNPTGSMYYFNFNSDLDIEEEFDIELVFANEAVGGASNPELIYKTYGKNDMCIVRNSSSMFGLMCLAGNKISASSGYDVFSIKVYTGGQYVPGSDAINSTERGFVVGLYRDYDPNNTATVLPVEVRIYTINY